jgi:exodeoxyribonuclease V alpha subunit
VTASDLTRTDMSATHISAPDMSATGISAPDIRATEMSGPAVATATSTPVDPGDIRLARRAPDELRRWNESGVIDAADVHVARRLCDMGGQADGVVSLAAALAVRALRLGHVCVELSTVASTVSTDVVPQADLSDAPWPDPPRWRTEVAASPIVAVGDVEQAGRPLRLVGDRLYLDRSWRQECLVAADLTSRSTRPVDVDLAVLQDGLMRLWPSPVADREVSDDGDREPDLQAAAAAAPVTRQFAVVAGGPGTGKTTTVARILALLADQAAVANRPPPRVALIAPTGKAAARLEEAVHREATRMPIAESTAVWIQRLLASTIHRLLGRRPDSQSRFRHDHRHRLPYDTVIIDETSMVSLSLMANVIDALRPDTRLVLVGDPEQLASVEAGAVLGDIVGPSTFSGNTLRSAPDDRSSPLADSIVVLRRGHRFGGAIAQLAGAIQAGDGDQVVDLVDAGHDDVVMIDDAPSTDATLAPVRDLVVDTFEQVRQAASGGDGAEALRLLASVRVLCAHRDGPSGLGAWTDRIETWLGSATPSFRGGSAWYVGRPLMVTVNDYELQLFNGDTGVIAVGPEGRLAAAFERRGALTWISPTRLRAAESVYAMTVHKSQGSQFDEVVVVLPEPTSPILTRQLLYTAVTRARTRVILVGSYEALRRGVERPISRASGLGDRLWPRAR